MLPVPETPKSKAMAREHLRFLAPTLWNILPGSVREKKKISSFRTVLKTHLFPRL
jgi:hypothetical protein